MTNAANEPVREAPVDVCVAKVGKPFQMRECGKPCEYLTKEESRIGYSGWYHVEQPVDHNAVPSRMIR
jgi:hypothetical protein